jgi:hypothetical protein
MLQPSRGPSRRSGRPLLASIILLIAPAIVFTQSLATQPGAGTQPDVIERSSASDALKSSAANLDDRLKALEDQLHQQSKALAEMQAIIADQQRMIVTLSARTPIGEPKSNEQKDLTTVAAVTRSPEATTQNQTPTIEDRVKKLEGQALKMGPLRFSGDFRLRYDGIFRRAEPNPPPGLAPLTHQQNSRMRYRLRLNFDADLYPALSFHGQLATGVLNNPISNDQDFGQMANRHLFTISEAWVDYHPKKNIQLQAGRLPNIFADNSRFMFDDDVRFNGFNEKYIWNLEKPFGYISNIEARAGQYILSNPNVAIVTAGSPLAQAGAIVGSTGRSANLFHQGVLFNQKYNDRWAGQFGGDVQLYRNPNQIQLASTANGVALLVQNGLGIVLSGPAGGGNATTSPGGAIYTAPDCKIARQTYCLNWAGFKSGNDAFPVTLNIQGSRNVGVSVPERDAMLAALQVGRITKKGDMAFLYIFTIKGANALISQFTDDDIGSGGVNIRSHGFRFELGLAKKVTFQSLLFIQNQLRSSGDFPNFFVPLNAFTPRQYRVQEQIVFNF